MRASALASRLARTRRARSALGICGALSLGACALAPRPHAGFDAYRPQREPGEPGFVQPYRTEQIQEVRAADGSIVQAIQLYVEPNFTVDSSAWNSMGERISVERVDRLVELDHTEGWMPTPRVQEHRDAAGPLELFLIGRAQVNEVRVERGGAMPFLLADTTRLARAAASSWEWERSGLGLEPWTRLGEEPAERLSDRAQSRRLAMLPPRGGLWVRAAELAAITDSVVIRGQRVAVAGLERRGDLSARPTMGDTVASPIGVVGLLERPDSIRLAGRWTAASEIGVRRQRRIISMRMEDPGEIGSHPAITVGDWERVKAEEAGFLRELERQDIRRAPMLLVCRTPPPAAGSRARHGCFRPGRRYRLRIAPGATKTQMPAADFTFRVEKRNGLLGAGVGLLSLLGFVLYARS
ncbi:MAG: hypothetical protein AVDCRST_MAG68-4671 [uncultured Gemmatimonadetes bacterium]|uniref:Uncharacterized protein n=1 Tax=uncultured Gemmatimonadota bacterium TaxID=203437 RepID=A0A6J4MMU8_9BACT|nr:MAG: hypothetical protein AVDCRST_MAG68-4671 [uncultured Gemmatimonadota bacterium]